jgi:hypothetical protein
MVMAAMNLGRGYARLKDWMWKNFSQRIFVLGKKFHQKLKSGCTLFPKILNLPQPDSKGGGKWKKG